MKTQTVHLGSTVVRHELGETWFDGSLRLVSRGLKRSFSHRRDRYDCCFAGLSQQP